MKRPKRKTPPPKRRAPNHRSSRSRLIDCQLCGRHYEVVSRGRPKVCAFCGSRNLRIEPGKSFDRIKGLMNTFLIGGCVAIMARLFASISPPGRYPRIQGGTVQGKNGKLEFGARPAPFQLPGGQSKDGGKKS